MSTILFYSILSLFAFDERAITKSQVMIEPRETHERCVYESLTNELQYCFCEISKIDTCIAAPRSDQLELNASRIPMRCCARDERKNISLLRYSVALVACRRNAFSRVLYRSSSLTSDVELTKGFTRSNPVTFHTEFTLITPLRIA